MSDPAFEHELIFLGSKLPAGVRETFPGDGMGALLTLNENEFKILIGVDGWQPHELAAIEQEKITFGLMRHHDCITLLCQVGRALMFDMTYDARKVPPGDAGIPVCEEGKGYFIKVVSFDTNTDQVVNLRALTITPEFSRALADHVQHTQSRKSLPSYNFDRAYGELMLAFPSPAGMWEHCLIEEVGGQKFRRPAEDEEASGPRPR